MKSLAYLGSPTLSPGQDAGTGAAAVTLGAVTLSAAGTSTLAGAAAATLGPVTLSAAGQGAALAYTNFWQSVSGNPTLTGAVAGRLLIAAANRSSATPPTADWTFWGSEAHGTTSLSQAFYWKIAAGGDTITWTNATGQRAVWEFSNGAIDTLNFSQGAGTTVLDLEAQPTMEPNSLVGMQVIINTAQTSIASAVSGFGLTQRANRNTSVSAWSGDSDTTLLNSFDPASGTFDTSGNWIAGVFSVKGA